MIEELHSCIRLSNERHAPLSKLVSKLLRRLWTEKSLCAAILSPVHTVTENGDCRRKRRPSPVWTGFYSNRNVFRSRLNCPISTSGWSNSAGKLFQSRGPATEKLLSPRRVLVGGTIYRLVHVRWSQSASTSVWDINISLILRLIIATIT